MAAFRQAFIKQPEAVSASVRANRNRELDGLSGLEQTGLRSTRGYIVKQLPLGHAKSAMYLIFGLAEVFDLMEQGKWKLAEAQVALLLVAAEQAALEDWRWPVAWSMTHLPDPPFHLMVKDANSHTGRPTSRLADPSWLATAIAMSKDVAALHEARRPPGGNRNNNRGGKDKAAGDGAAGERD